MKTRHKPHGAITNADGTKIRLYFRGCNPNSLRNLKPQRRGEPSHGPFGRRGKGDPRNALELALFGPDWIAWKRDMERTTKLLNRVFKAEFGVTADQLWERERGRG